MVSKLERAGGVSQRTITVEGQSQKVGCTNQITTRVSKMKGNDEILTLNGLLTYNQPFLLENHLNKNMKVPKQLKNTPNIYKIN
jgi:hypothetical protein